MNNWKIEAIKTDNPDSCSCGSDSEPMPVPPKHITKHETTTTTTILSLTDITKFIANLSKKNKCAENKSAAAQLILLKDDSYRTCKKSASN